MASSSNKTVRFVIKTVTEGGKDVQALQVNVKDLAEMISATQKKADKGFHVKADAIGFDAITDMIGKLDSVIQDLSGAYQVQEVNETRLATAMRNTMSASAEEIQSIKNLCSEEETLGVVSKDAQMQGAQELATYLETTDALKKLIPVMNNMAVQQYGLEVSGESAMQIATMLGKVMNGQTKALSRYGYSFSEVEENILKFGDEAERAAILAEVVGRSVNGMNYEMGQTNSGKMKKAADVIEGIKAKIGEAIASFSPYIHALGEVGTAALGVSTTIKSFTALFPSVSTNLISAAKAVKTFATSLRGLMIATGVGAAIAAVTWAISELIEYCNKEEESLKRLDAEEERLKKRAEEAAEAEKRDAEAVNAASVAIKLNIERLKNFVGTKAEEKKIVKEMNDTYGETMGYFSSVSSWYKTLTQNSNAYCQQLLNEVKVKRLVSEIDTMETENAEIDKRKNLSEEEGGYSKKRTKSTTDREYLEDGSIGAGYYDVETFEEGSSEYEEMMFKHVQNMNDIAEKRSQVQKLLSSPVKLPVTGSKDPNIIDADKIAREAEKAKKAAEREAEQRKEAEEKADKKIIAIRQKTIDDRIELLEDDERKEFAILRKTYQDKIEEINQQEKELTDLRIKSGKEGLDESEKELFDFARDIARQTYLKAKDELKPLDVKEIRTYDELSKALTYWNEKFENANEKDRQQIRQTISSLNDLQASFDLDQSLFDAQKDLSKLKGLDSKQFNMEVKSTGMDGWLDKMKEMQRIMADTSATDAQKEAAKELADEYRKLAAESVNYFDVFSSGWGAFKGIGNSVKSLTDALSGQKNAWETVTGVIDSAISIYQTFSQIMQMINTLSEIFTVNKEAEAVATQMSTAAKVEGAAEEVAADATVVAANSVETTSEVAKASAKTFSAHASVPWVGIAIAGGMVAAMLATMLSLPKFADGGVVSGPTLGLIGEYAGASGNPEVVAPLDKLQSMIGGTPGVVLVKGESHIRGKDIVMVLKNETSVSSKSGRKTGIKI